MTIKTSELGSYLSELLRPQDFRDYGPNGLQVEGSDEIKKIAFAVSATKASVHTAVEKGADCMIVHHGLFWKFHGPKTITGPFAKRLAPLIKNNVNLFGYHLPLDAHLEVGNAASLARKIGMSALLPYGDYKGCPTGVHGEFKKPLTAVELKKMLEEVLNHSVMLASPDESASIKRMAIITGGANGDWVDCPGMGIDAYLTGEMSEHDWHESQEAGIHMFAGGHNATEQFGVQSLKEMIDKEFDVETFYIDSENPA